jgi:hypothetical protein
LHVPRTALDYSYLAGDVVRPDLISTDADQAGTVRMNVNIRSAWRWSISQASSYISPSIARRMEGSKASGMNGTIRASDRQVDVRHHVRRNSPADRGLQRAE